MEIKIDLTKTLAENANAYFEKAKKIKNKILGAEKALKETQEKIANLEKKEVEISNKPKVKEKKNKKWFEAFRYFISAENFLVVGGKDATSNEVLIKKYSTNQDIVFHSDVFGSPFFVIKDGIKAGEKTLKETARICASYSRAWKHELGSCDVYCVNYDQVSKTAKSGEFLSKGSFMIYGERRWFKNVELKIYIGFQGKNAILRGSDENLEHYACIIPGSEKAKDIVEKIKKAYKRKNIILEIPDEEIQRLIPYNKGHLEKVV